MGIESSKRAAAKCRNEPEDAIGQVVPDCDVHQCRANLASAAPWKENTDCRNGVGDRETVRFRSPIRWSYWIVAAVWIVFARLATRGMKQVTYGAQNFLEWLVEGLYNFPEE